MRIEVIVPMALFDRVYFNAVFGGLGGLFGWMVFAILGDALGRNDEWAGQLVLGGAFIGGIIGYFVVSVDAIRDRALVRFFRLASYGVILGGIGGALGLWLGDWVNFKLVEGIGAVRGTKELLLTAFARGLGWMLLGIAVGACEGIASRSGAKLLYGMMGGALGGFVGGVLFALFYERAKTHAGSAAIWSALGLIILGACIGGLSALVRIVFQPASLRVLKGWQEGREYPLEATQNWLGRDEHADVALFRDMKIEKKHARIDRQEGEFVFVNSNAPAEFTRVNGDPIPRSCRLKDGDRIELGNALLRFQTRAARNGSRSR